jgi:hypothetical protein
MKLWKDVKIGEVILFINIDTKWEYEVIKIEPRENESNCIYISLNVDFSIPNFGKLKDTYVISDWFEEEPLELMETLCKCDLLTVVMRYGCQCGGK